MLYSQSSYVAFNHRNIPSQKTTMIMDANDNTVLYMIDYVLPNNSPLTISVSSTRSKSVLKLPVTHPARLTTLVHMFSTGSINGFLSSSKHLQVV